MNNPHSFQLGALVTLRSAIASVKQRDLANELGVSEPHISQLKRQTNPTIAKIGQILAAVERIKGRKA